MAGFWAWAEHRVKNDNNVVASALDCILQISLLVINFL
jgi:hypothetical protein